MTLTVIIHKGRPVKLLNPFELHPAVQQFAGKTKTGLREKLGREPSSPELLARTLQSVILPSQTFESDGAVLSGLTKDAGGLEIRYSEDANEPLRRLGHAALLPHEIITRLADVNRYDEEEYYFVSRVAVCIEFSLLLITLLRSQGFGAWINRANARHVNAYAQADQSHWLLDACVPSLQKIEERPSSVCDDHQATVLYYNKKAMNELGQHHLLDAWESIDIALQLDPSYSVTYLNIAAICSREKNNGGALLALNDALRLEPTNATYLLAKAQTLFNMREYNLAYSCALEAQTLDSANQEINQLCLRLKRMFTPCTSLADLFGGF